MTGEKTQSVILGFGNTILRDDGIGVSVGEEVAEQLGIEFEPCSMFGFEIIDRISGYEQVFVIDSILVEEKQVGKLFEFDLEDFKNCRHISSPHSTNFAGGLKVAEQLELSVPEEVKIFGIGVQNTNEFGTELSQPLADQYETIVGKIKKLISNHIHHS